MTAHRDPRPHVAADASRGSWREHDAARRSSCRDVADALRSAAGGLAEAARLLDEAEEFAGIPLAAWPRQAVMDGSVPSSRPKPLLSARGVAERLGVDPKTVRRWREAGKLPPAIDVAGVLRWRPEEIEAWLREREGKSR